MARYLTKRGDTALFQIRLPRAVDPDFSLAPIRVTLGVMRIREAERTAAMLAGAAHLAFRQARIRMQTTPDAGPAPAAVAEAVKGQLEALLPLLRGLDEAAFIHASSPRMAAAMAQAGLDGLLALAADRLAGSSALVAADADALARHYTRLITDEAAARSHLDLAPLPPAPTAPPGITDALQQLLDAQAALQVQVAGLAAKAEVRGPLFSAASAAYQAKLREAHGASYDELKYLSHRTAVFLALCEDKPVNLYTEADLQEFVNRVAFMPANCSKLEGYDLARIGEIIEANKTRAQTPISKSTLKNNYLGKVRTILRAGCREAQIPFHLDDIRITFPKVSPPKRQRLAPDYERLNAIFKVGLASGELTKALLPLTGFLTGRRLGLLAYLRGQDIKRYHATWIAIPPTIVMVEGRYRIVPYKTEESLSFFVLHNFLAEIGFIDWAIRQEGFLFASLHEGIKDPADTAQKRMGRLFREAGAETAFLESFHSLRTAKINFDRDLRIDPRTTRLQVGHELLDVHEEYGGSLRRSELKQIADTPLPAEIDWTMFQGLEFDRLAAARPQRGRPPKGSPSE